MTAPSSPRDNGGQRTSTAAALVLLWLAVIVLPLPVREVMPPDESRFAHQAEVMHTSGDWIVPRIGDVPNADKPPGLFWSVNLVSLVTGHVTETTARVPSALAALMVMFLTVRLGRRLWGDATLGLGAAAMLVTGVEFSQKGQWCSCDMLLTAFSLGASTLWREAVFERERGGHLMIAAGWLCAAIATLTKGPLGLLWPLWWVIAEAAARRRWKPTLALLVPSGPVLYLLLVFGWLTAFKAGAGETLAHEALFTQTVTRYLNSWNSFQPPYFFLIQTPGDFFPWSLFFPAAAVAWWRLRRDADATTGVDRVAWRASLVFLGIALVFFSLSPGKRGVYLLPAFPMLALCTARGFLSIGGRWRRVPLRLLACVGIVVGLVIPLVVAVIRPRVALDWGERVGFGWVAALVACGASLSIGALFALRRHDSAPRALASVVAGMAVCLSILGTLGGAAWSRYQDGSGFGTVVATIVPRAERLVMGRGKFELVLFYSNRRGTEVQNEEALVDELRSGRARYVVLSREFYQQVRGRPEVAQLTLLADRWVGNTNLLLLGPPSAAGVDEIPRLRAGHWTSTAAYPCCSASESVTRRLIGFARPSALPGRGHAPVAGQEVGPVRSEAEVGEGSCQSTALTGHGNTGARRRSAAYPANAAGQSSSARGSTAVPAIAGKLCGRRSIGSARRLEFERGRTVRARRTLPTAEEWPVWRSTICETVDSLSPAVPGRPPGDSAHRGMRSAIDIGSTPAKAER